MPLLQPGVLPCRCPLKHGTKLAVIIIVIIIDIIIIIIVIIVWSLWMWLLVWDIR